MIEGLIWPDSLATRKENGQDGTDTDADGDAQRIERGEDVHCFLCLIGVKLLRSSACGFACGGRETGNVRLVACGIRMNVDANKCRSYQSPV